MLALINIFPIGKGESLSADVARAVDVIDQSGLDYRLTSMGTIVEGNWNAVMKLLKKLRDTLLKNSKRIYLTVSIDERYPSRKRIKTKVSAVEARLKRKLKK